MIRRTLIGLIFCTSIMTGVIAYEYQVNHNYKLRINSLETQLETKKQDLFDMQNKYDKFETETRTLQEGLNSEINRLQTEVNNLNKQVQDMTKEVSFNPYNVRQVSGATEYHMRKAFDESPVLRDLSHAFVRAEQEYGINAYFIASIVALESSWGTSERANNGSNNLTGYAVYHNLSRGRYFDSKEESVMETARLINEDYLDPNGIWHNGYSVDNVNTKYSADTEWDAKIISIADSLITKSNS